MAKVIPQSFEILTEIDGKKILKHIEKVARTCYKSEDKITTDDSSARQIIATLIKLGHEAMIEHFSISVKFVTDLSFYKDVTRHRIASFAIESTRYCNYTKGKFGGDLTFIKPVNIDDKSPEYKIWYDCMVEIEKAYFAMGKLGCRPDQMRMLLPHSIKADVNLTANLREWRHIFKLRAAKTAHPGIVALMRPLLAEFKKKIPVIFDDINFDD